MSQAQIAELLRQFEELIGPIEGDDPKTRKRRMILDAAQLLFVKQGYRKTSMDEVAREAGVAKGTLYLYFATKVDIAITVFAREKRIYFDRVMDVFDESLPARTRLKKWVVGILMAAVEMPLFGRLMTGDKDLFALLEDLPPELMAKGVQNRHEIFGEILSEAAGDHSWTDVELRDRIDALSGLAFFSPMLLQEHVLCGMSPPRYAAVMADMIVDGLCRRAEESP
jgi:AcrR family transcriptional regulator